MADRYDNTPLPTQILTYLWTRGWSQTRESDGASQWTLAHESRTRNVVVIEDQDDPDFEAYFTLVVARLSEIEQRGRHEIVRDLLAAARDTFSVRIHGPSVDAGEIPVSYGPELFAGVHDLLKAAGRSLKETRANYGSAQIPSEVSQALDAMKFGTTLAGSYIVTVRTPPEQQLALPGTGPASLSFERQTVIRTIEAVSAARDLPAVDDLGSDEQEQAIDEAIDKGLSAQLCSALEHLDTLDAGISVDLSAVWSDASPDPVAKHMSVSLGAADLSRIKMLGSTLSRNEPTNDFFLQGWIKEIKFGEQWAQQGVIVVEGRVFGRSRNVHVKLKGDDFSRAHQLAGHGHIECRGILEKAGRAWALSEPVNIRFEEGTRELTD